MEDCTTTFPTPNRRLYSHRFKGSLTVVLHLKCQTDPRCNHTVRKVMSTQNPVLVRLYKSLIATITLSCRREKPRKKIESIASARQREIKRREKREQESERESRHRSLIISVVFYCTFHTCLLAGSVFTASWRVWDFFAGAQPKWAV